LPSLLPIAQPQNRARPRFAARPPWRWTEARRPACTPRKCRSQSIQMCPGRWPPKVKRSAPDDESDCRHQKLSKAEAPEKPDRGEDSQRFGHDIRTIETAAKCARGVKSCVCHREGNDESGGDSNAEACRSELPRRPQPRGSGDYPRATKCDACSSADGLCMHIVLSTGAMARCSKRGKASIPPVFQ